MDFLNILASTHLSTVVTIKTWVQDSGLKTLSTPAPATPINNAGGWPENRPFLVTVRKPISCPMPQNLPPLIRSCELGIRLLFSLSSLVITFFDPPLAGLPSVL
jgi:hypothetical protein